MNGVISLEKKFIRLELRKKLFIFVYLANKSSLILDSTLK